MKNRTLLVIALLSLGILMGVFSYDVMAQKTLPGGFATDKSDRTLIKSILVKQDELKGMIQQIDRKIGRLGICQ